MTKNETTPTIATLETARHLAVSGAIQAASLQYFPGGWLLVLVTKSGGSCAIKTARGKPRLFKNLDTAAKAAKSIFLEAVYVKLDHWDTEQTTIEGL